MVKKFKQDKIFEYFLKTLNFLEKKSDTNFAGLGMLVYDKDFLKDKSFISLRPGKKPPENVSIRDEKAVEYLINISDKNHNLHDGFIFIDLKGCITHISQFVEVKITPDINPHTEHGTRYVTSLVVSKNKNVKFVGNVTSNLSKFVFIDGKAFFLKGNPKLKLVKA